MNRNEIMFYAWLNEIIDRRLKIITEGAKEIEVFYGNYPGNCLNYRIWAPGPVIHLFITRADGSEFEYKRRKEEI